MEIHKPKPMHNLREFLGEVAVIVLGIVIALTAEQIVQSMEWRHKVKLAEAQMRDEIGNDDGPQVFQRLALSPCVNDTLDTIRESVERDGPRSALVEAIDRFRTPRHTWDSTAFQSAIASGVVAHESVEEVGMLSYFYSFMPALERANEREFHDGATLRAISRIGGGLTETERSRVLESAEALRRDNAEILRLATLAKDAMRLLNVRPADWRRLPGQGPSLGDPDRVVKELEQSPMAQNCVVALKQSLALRP